MTIPPTENVNYTTFRRMKSCKNGCISHQCLVVRNPCRSVTEGPSRGPSATSPPVATGRAWHLRPPGRQLPVLSPEMSTLTFWREIHHPKCPSDPQRLRVIHRCITLFYGRYPRGRSETLKHRCDFRVGDAGHAGDLVDVGAETPTDLIDQHRLLLPTQQHDILHLEQRLA